MKATKKRQADGTFAVHATASAEEVAEAFRGAYLEFVQRTGIRPQPGKSLPDMAKEQLGIKDLDAVVAPTAAESLIPFAIDKAGIVPLYPPKPHFDALPKGGMPYEFDFILAPKPACELESYDPVTVKMPAAPDPEGGQQAVEQYEFAKRQLAVAELAKRFKGAIPDEAYEAMAGMLMANVRAGAQQQGMTYDQFAESQGGHQQVTMMIMLQARQMIAQGLALDAVFRHEKLSVREEDVLEACRGMNPQFPEQVRMQMEAAGRGFALREAAERQRASVWVADHAVVEPPVA